MRFPFTATEEGETVHSARRTRWTEESFLDLPHGGETAPSAFLGTFQGGRRLSAFFFVVAVIFSFFLARTAYLQIAEGNVYAQRAERNRIRVIIDRASRGLILDVKGRPLVANKPEFILTTTPAEFPAREQERREVFARVARILRISPLTFVETMSALPKDPFIRRQALPFRERIAYEDALQLIVEEERMPGFRVEMREQRAYPETYGEGNARAAMPESIAHVIGYLGKITTDELPARQKQGYLASDLVGRDGIERAHEAQLRGKHGKRFIEIDALGEERTPVRAEPAEAGRQLTLSIDLDLQRALETALQERLASLPKRERRGAVGIAMDPRNGRVRALVSLPSYPSRFFSGGAADEDIQRTFTDPAQPLFPRAVAGEYPSGSTIKPLIALAALEEGVITPGTTILSSGGISVGPWFFPDWKKGGHGLTDVRRAIAESINTFFYTIGGGYGGMQGLGVERIEKWMKKFHFGESLGIDLPNEATGLIPTPQWKEKTRGEVWYIGDSYHLAIGQGDILATPLQIAAMTSVFANGGTLWRPSLLEDQPSEALATAIASKENLNVVRQGMRWTVTRGSAQFLNALPVAVAGKTGTAEWSSKRPPHAWFTGFAPYENPELVVTILVEEGGEGSTTAVPVAYEVFREYFK